MSWLEIFYQGALWPVAITSGVLTVAIAAEMLAPRRELSAHLGWRWGNNLALAIVTWGVGHSVSVGVYLTTAQWASERDLGLFSGQADTFWLPFLALLITAQFLAYVTHILSHRYPLLWRLHEIHHSDVDVDVSTSYRHHPLEALVFLPIVTPIIILLGIPPTAALAYQGVNIGITVLAHSNFRLPEGLDRWLSKLIVTPDFHRLHHASEQRYTNSNYGGIVPWFDYLFGTATHRAFDEHEQFEIGLQYHRSPHDSRVDQMLLAPIQKPPSSNG